VYFQGWARWQMRAPWMSPEQQTHQSGNIKAHCTRTRKSPHLGGSSLAWNKTWLKLLVQLTVSPNFSAPPIQNCLNCCSEWVLASLNDVSQNWLH
jgi:hypothetical protein